MRRVAFFDMDGTVMAANSGRAYIEALRREGALSRLELVRAAVLLVRYAAGAVDLEEAMRRIVAASAGTEVSVIARRAAAVVKAELLPSVYAEALERTAHHRAKGDTVVLLSASLPWLAEPVARIVGAHACLCTRPRVADGVLTGAVEGRPCAGAGKAWWARRWCREHGVALSAATLYTDSYTDLAVLEAVGRPVAVNPDVRLWRHARRRGWPIERFRKMLGMTRVTSSSEVDAPWSDSYRGGTT